MIFKNLLLPRLPCLGRAVKGTLGKVLRRPSRAPDKVSPRKGVTGTCVPAPPGVLNLYVCDCVLIPCVCVPAHPVFLIQFCSEDTISAKSRGLFTG